MTEPKPAPGAELLVAALDAVTEAVILLDGDRRVAFASRQVAELLGIAPASLLGQRLPEAVEAVWDELADPTAVLAGVRATYARSEAPRQCDLRLRNGRTLRCRSIPVGERGLAGRVLVLTDSPSAGTRESLVEDLVTGLAFAQGRDLTRHADELRDGPLESFGAALLRLDALAPELASAAPSLAGQVSALVGDLRAAYEETHGLLDLDPRRIGLAGAVGLLLERFSAATAVGTTLDPDVPPHLPADVELLAFRVVREVLDQLRACPGAEAVGVQLSDADEFTCEVVVRGPQLDPHFLLGEASAALGFARDYVELAGGRLELEHEPGREARVRLSLPAELA